MADLHGLLLPAKCVLFDFDGPICRLFHAHPPRLVANRMRVRLADLGDEDLLAEVDGIKDPYRVLSHVAHSRPGSRTAAALEKQLTSEELAAVATAEPTDLAAELIATLSRTGRQVAVTTNNSPLSVRRYLARMGISRYFGPHIHGRTKEARHLKPDPDCLFRALDSTGAKPAQTIMIGDTPADLRAARTTGVTFIGYATGPDAADTAEKARALETAGAEPVLHHFQDLLQAAEAMGRPPLHR